jgi:hypothetical protein
MPNRNESKRFVIGGQSWRLPDLLVNNNPFHYCAEVSRSCLEIEIL